MSATGTRLAPPIVRTAERAGRLSRPSEDRIFVTDHAVIVLDGASQPDAADHDGGWYAQTLGGELQLRLYTEPNTELAQALAASIAAVSARNNLRAGGPSATVAIVRWTKDVDVLVLGDSPVVGLTRDGQILQVRDNRLRRTGREYRQQLADAAGFGTDHRDLWRRLVEAERVARNKPGGYWIAESVPHAAHQARRATWPRSELTAVLALTDGVSCGVDRYAAPENWPEAFKIAMQDPAELVSLVHKAEAGDPSGTRWRRSKLHDDKALAVIDFATEWPA
jgi:Protein phosphatase 2C